ncbi:unnamed protein product [Effrenium voratum]|nr:unnamed protein product [Effrenium voratum]
MQSLKAFAQSTFGELKEALADDDDEEESPTPKALPPLASAAWPEAPSNALGGRGEAAKLEFAALAQSPCFNVLSKLDEDLAGKWGDPDLPLADMAVLACRTLRKVLPMVAIEASAPSETQRMLTSFSERYEQLLAENAALQQKARELSAAKDTLEAAASQAEACRSAHRAAIARVEELSSESAELKERMRSQGLDSEEHERLLRKLDQKDAEIRAGAEAMQRLQEVVEDQSAMSSRCWALERELAAAKAAAAAERANAPPPPPPPTEAAQGQDSLMGRCLTVEKELKETSAALEVLLEEKAQRLADQEHLVDRRLVTSMLALYHDHVSSGQRALAEQVLNQTLQILGGVPEEANLRQRVKVAEEAAKKRLARPLGNAFVDFLAARNASAKRDVTRKAKPTIRGRSSTDQGGFRKMRFGF